MDVSKYVCINCISKLDCFYKFKQWCLRNNTIVTNYLQTLTSIDETYKYLSVSLTDIINQNKQQAVNTDQTFSVVENDDELQSEGKEDNATKETEAVCKNKSMFTDILDISHSHPLFDEEKDIIVKEEDLIFEDTGDFEFYHEFAKRLKYEAIPSDSDDSVTDNEDVHEDSEESNQSYEKILTNHEENKNTEKNDPKKTNRLQCLICSKEFVHKHELKCHLEAHADSEVGIMQSKTVRIDTKTNRSKKQACLYCSKLVIQLPRHFELKHAEETEVRKIMSLKKRNSERFKLLDRLRKKGNFINNSKFLTSETGHLVVKKRFEKFNEEQFCLVLIV